MADEEQVEQIEEEKSPSIIGKILPIAITILVPIILALVVLKLFVLPMLAEEDEEEPEPVAVIDKYEVTLRFEMPPETVQTDANDPSRPLLMYTVMLVCSNQETADLVASNQDRFLSKISSIHRNRTLKLLDDPAFQDYLATQTQEELNILLRRLAPGGEHEIREVAYLQFTTMSV